MKWEKKRDAFSDIDLNCVCTELPTAAMRDQFVERLAPDGSDAFGCFLYLGLKATGVHMSFVSQANQDACFRQRREQGREFPFIEITNERFAAGSYYWSRGTILSDSDDVLSSYQSEARQVPQRYYEATTSRTSLAWQRYCEMFPVAVQRRDRITAMMALNGCTQAVIRQFLIEHKIHMDPISPPKWAPIEIRAVPEDMRSGMRGLDWVPADAGLPWDDRFSQLNKLWDTYI